MFLSENKYSVYKGILLSVVIVLLTASSLFAQVAENHVKAGKKYMLQAKYKEAAKAFRAAIETDSSYLPAFEQLIELRKRENDIGSVIKLAEEALRRNPTMDIGQKGHFHHMAAQACLGKKLVLEAYKHIEKARDLLGDDPAVLQTMEAISQRKSSYVKELIQQGDSAFNQKNYKDAADVYGKARLIAADDSDLAAKFREARNLLEKENSLKNALEIMGKAEALLKEHKWDDALPLLEAAKSQAPWSEDILARMEAGRQIYQDFQDRVNQELEEKDRIQKAREEEAYLIREGKGALLSERWNKAIECYTKVLKLNPSNKEVRVHLKEAQDAKKLRVSFEEGKKFLVDGDYEKAASKFAFVYKRTPHSKTTLIKLCESLEKTGKVEEAIEKYKRFVSENPNAFDFYVKIGDLHAGIKQYDKANSMYRLYLVRHPEDIKVGMRVAENYLKIGEDEEALKIYKKFSKYEQDNLEIREKIVDIYLKGKDYDEALKALEGLVESSTEAVKDAEYFYVMANVYMEKKSYGEALKKFKECRNTLPGYKDVDHQIRTLRWKQFIPILIAIAILALLPLLKFLLGFRLSLGDLFKGDKKAKLFKNITAYKHHGKWEKVISECEKLRVLPLVSSESRDLYQDLSMAYLRLGRYTEAMAEAERLLSVDKQNRTALTVLGKSYLGMGNYDKAIMQCKITFETDPENGSMHEIFQEAYRKMGQLNELMVEYEAMTASYPDSMFVRNLYLKVESELAGAR